MNDLPLISIAIPVFNEEANLNELFRRLTSVFDSLKHSYRFEIVACENGSTDGTFKKLQDYSEIDPRLKIVRLSRNFHMEGGMMAALSCVSGEAAIIMSADLQDPPELIPQMLENWRNGIDHVYTVITYRHGESKFRRMAAELFYWMIDKVSDTPVPKNSSDFRLVDKQMYQAFNALPEKYRMVRSTWGWIGFSSSHLEYERPSRIGGTSSFNPFVTGAFAIRGLLASSLTPLKFIPIIGLIFSAFSFLGLIFFGTQAFLFGVPFSGFGSLISIIFLMFGMLFILLSILAEYIGMIYIESRSRPTFIVRNERKDSR